MAARGRDIAAGCVCVVMLTQNLELKCLSQLRYMQVTTFLFNGQPLIHTLVYTAAQPSQGGSLEDAAYRCYRKRSGEEALLERKQKQRRISASLDYFCKREVRDLHKSHYQYLTKLHQQSNSKDPCTTAGCEHTCLPYSNRCSRRILHTNLIYEYITC